MKKKTTYTKTHRRYYLANRKKIITKNAERIKKYLWLGMRAEKLGLLSYDGKSHIKRA